MEKQDAGPREVCAAGHQATGRTPREYDVCDRLVLHLDALARPADDGLDLYRLADQPAEHVELVNRLAHDDATARSGPSPAPGPAAVVARGSIPVAGQQLAAADLADGARGDRLAGLCGSGAVSPLYGDVEAAAALGRLANEQRRLGGQGLGAGATL